MRHALPARSCIAATVDQVMPCLGLAYVVDDAQREWAVTRCTPGSGLDSLERGRRVVLTVEDHDRFCVVSSYGDLA